MTEESKKTSCCVAAYAPPIIWVAPEGGMGMNRPDAGARSEMELPVGKHPLQLYSMGTPNGVKVTIMLEELLALGITGAEYDAYHVPIFKNEQFTSGFVNVNPNSKIPAMVDHSTDLVKPINVFESGNILFYLAEKFGHLLPKDISGRTAVMNWLFWLQGSAPSLGGGFGHFYHYAPVKQEYPINRYTMETKRLFDVLDKQLENNTYVAGSDYSIADVAVWPWFAPVYEGKIYGNAAEFLQVHNYKNVSRWVKVIGQRPAVKRGIIVNKTWGEEWEKLEERHSAADIDEKLKLNTAA